MISQGFCGSGIWEQSSQLCLRVFHEGPVRYWQELHSPEAWLGLKDSLPSSFTYVAVQLVLAIGWEPQYLFPCISTEDGLSVLMAWLLSPEWLIQENKMESQCFCELASETTHSGLPLSTDCRGQPWFNVGKMTQENKSIRRDHWGHLRGWLLYGGRKRMLPWIFWSTD